MNKQKSISQQLTEKTFLELGLNPNPGKYGSLRAKLREYTGKDIDPKSFTFEISTELINKTDWLMKRTVNGIDKKIITDETKKLRSEINSHWMRHW